VVRVVVVELAKVVVKVVVEVDH
jgi:hypothetical protein